MDSVGEHLDRISDLPDDLLHLILAAVGEAVDVTNTAVLSRRWRRVWIHAQRLDILDENVTDGPEPGRFEDFVDWVFTQRGYTDIGSLDIMYGFLDDDGNGTQVKDEPPIKMPGHGRMSSITIDLCRRRLQLPVAATAKYEALTELTLLYAFFDEEELGGGARSLGDFVSSCCPRLRKLDIRFPAGLRHLVLRTEALEELNLCFARCLRTLDVTAPKLQVLKVDGCFEVDVVGNAVRVSANRLDKVGVQGPGLWGVGLDIHGSASVRCLEPIDLYMHGQHYCRYRGSALYLLDNCLEVEQVKLSLQHWNATEVIEDDEIVDLVSSSSEGVPLRSSANVRSMKMTVMEVHDFPEGHLVASMSSLLARFPHLRSLRIKFIPSGLGGWQQECLRSRLDTWADPLEISLGYLEEVTISGFMGADDDVDLVRLLFASSNSMKSMTLKFECNRTKASTPISLKQMMTEEDGSGIETVDQKLMNITSSASRGRGHWHFGTDVYTWTIK